MSPTLTLFFNILLVKISTTTTPLEFLGSFLFNLSSVLTSLTVIFKVSISTLKFFSSFCFLFPSLNSLEDSNLPNFNFFVISFKKSWETNMIIVKPF